MKSLMLSIGLLFVSGCAIAPPRETTTVAYDFGPRSGRPAYGHRIVRLNIGLEDTSDLQSDLEQSLSKMN